MLEKPRIRNETKNIDQTKKMQEINLKGEENDTYSKRNFSRIGKYGKW